MLFSLHLGNRSSSKRKMLISTSLRSTGGTVLGGGRGQTCLCDLTNPKPVILKENLTQLIGMPTNAGGNGQTL